MTRFFGFLLVITAFVSCQKTVDTPPIETPAEDSTCRIKQMRQGALDIHDSISNYVYDDQNRLITINRESPDDGAQSSYHFEYDGLGRVKQIQNFIPSQQGTGVQLVSKADYHYTGSLLTKIEIDDAFFYVPLIVTLEYDNSGKLISKSYEGIFVDFPIDNHVTFEYDARGNISRKREYDHDTLEAIKEFAYNDDENIVKSFGLGTESIVGYDLTNVLDVDAYLNTNNLTSVIDKWPDGRIFSKSEITYIRDSTNRIIRVDSKRTVGPFSPGVFNYHFFYECK